MPAQFKKHLSLNKKVIKPYEGHSYQIDFWGRPSEYANVDRENELSDSFSFLNAHYKGHEFAFLNQTHGNDCIFLEKTSKASQFYWGTADSALSYCSNIALSVRVADCIPILFWSSEEICLGVIHAGWRGLSKKILNQTMHFFEKKIPHLKKEKLFFWIGPHIHADFYEVDQEVYSKFDPEFSIGNKSQKKLDMSYILKSQFEEELIDPEQIIWDDEDTFHSNKLYSHRKGDTGRNIGVILANP